MYVGVYELKDSGFLQFRCTELKYKIILAFD